MNREVADQQTGLIQAFSEANYFSVAIANAFTWTGHAVADNKEFFEAAINYLNSGNLAALDKTSGFAGKFGAEKLADGLRSWRTILSHIQVANVQKTTARGLAKLQDHCREVADRLQKQRLIIGIGLWLLYAPFKIVAAHREDLWADGQLDEVRMPMGLEVIRGIKKLIRKGSSWTGEYDVNLITEEDWGSALEQGMATAEMVHDISGKITHDKEIDCAAALRRVVHANSGLYLLGKNQLVTESATVARDRCR